jgi:hypothetical protein
MHYFFCSGGDWYGFHKKHIGTRYGELLFFHPVGCVGHIVHSSASVCETSTHYFLCLGGTSMDSTNCAPRHVTPNLCFCIWWVCRSHSAFQCVRGTKCQCTIFHSQVGTVRIAQNHVGTCYAELVFLNPVASMGHVVHSDVNALFFMLRW